MTNKRKKPTFKKNFYEESAWENDLLICGIDEVGRGCLAGPLVTAAVIIPPYKHHQLLKDSKVLTELEREKAYKWIAKHCWFGIGIVNNRVIDTHNIWHADLLAMKRALVQLIASAPKPPATILVDAMPLTLDGTGYFDIPIEHFIKGEKKSTSIAAASIVAKITRDALMTNLASTFPLYFFNEHKGYSTKKHQNAVVTYGKTIIHRDSFLTKFTLSQTLKEDDHGNQETLC